MKSLTSQSIELNGDHCEPVLPGDVAPDWYPTEEEMERYVSDCGMRISEGVKQ